MQMPTFDKLMLPTLKALEQLGGSGSIEEINSVLQALNLPDAITSQPHNPEKSSQTVSSGYKIQPAKETDIPLLNAIEAAAATIFPPGSLPENVLAERVPADILTDALHQNRLLVAVDATQAPVGYAFWQNVTGFALLAQVDVHPQHGRKGLGTALVTRMIDQVVQAGFPYLYLTTFSDVPWNAPFYQKLGFILLDADSQPDFIKESLRDEQERGMNNRVAMRYTIQA